MPKSSIASDLRKIRRSIQSLDRALARVAASSARGLRSGAAPGKRKLNLSPARRAALKLQGQYMGYLRNLGLKQKAEVKALKVAKGIRPAIARAKKLAGR